MFPTQRRKGAKKKPKKRGSALRLCVFAWEIFPWHLSFCAMPRKGEEGT
jgi:hypothetical protein